MYSCPEFQLTRSRGAWRGGVIWQWQKSKFQLTRSRGAWRRRWSRCDCHRHFNSHAHVERDEFVCKKCHDNFISTHTLTWSVTAQRERPEAIRWQFQLTRSRGAWLYCFKLNSSKLCHFNSHAHVERDDLESSCYVIFTISTHTLTWSVTETWMNLVLPERFQLTRSRGAWLSVDRPKSFRIWFQLTRSRGAWLYMGELARHHWYFNSHAHVERDFAFTPIEL